MNLFLNVTALALQGLKFACQSDPLLDLVFSLKDLAPQLRDLGVFGGLFFAFPLFFFFSGLLDFLLERIEPFSCFLRGLALAVVSHDDTLRLRLRFRLKLLGDSGLCGERGGVFHAVVHRCGEAVALFGHAEPNLVAVVTHPIDLIAVLSLVLGGPSVFSFFKQTSLFLSSQLVQALLLLLGCLLTALLSKQAFSLDLSLLGQSLLFKTAQII